MTTCVLCGGEIPAGWPVAVLPAGLAHRFVTMCEELPPPEEQACRFLESRGHRLGFDFGLPEATERAGALILDPGGAKAA